MGCKVSIVVPVYNAEKYLDQCVTSIMGQTYRHLEIILVNDGSTDHSLEICRKYAETDERITVVEQINQGVVKARKTGVEAATGDFIGWADADDWMESGYIEGLVRLQEESNADIVAATHFHDIGSDSRLIKNGVDTGIYDVKQLLPVMLYTGEFFEYGITPQLYTKLFRADILKKTQFMVADNIIAGDDAAVVYPSLLMAEKVCVSNITGYHYVQHPASITKTGFSDEPARIRMLIEYLNDIFRKAGVSEWMNHQLATYENYMLALRQIDIFDAADSEKILVPYGGFRENDRLVIYGAGVLGQKIYHYLEADGRVKLTGWLDKNYEVYRKQGFGVDSSDLLSKVNLEFDYIVIANITESVAMMMKDFLLASGVAEEKIRWFSAEFLGRA
jgi:glycosyltransferase involved in cell wall biosynthesis